MAQPTLERQFYRSPSREWYRSTVACPRQNCHLTHPDNPSEWCRACLLSLVERVRSNASTRPLVRLFERDSLRGGYW